MLLETIIIYFLGISCRLRRSQNGQLSSARRFGVRKVSGSRTNISAMAVFCRYRSVSHYYVTRSYRLKILCIYIYIYVYVYRDCESYFGRESIKPISSDDSVICDTSFSKIVPLENGEVSVKC